MGVTADGYVISNAVVMYNYASGTNVYSTAAVSISSTTAAAAPSTSAPVGVAVGASIGGVMCCILLVAAIWKFRQRGNKMSPDENKQAQELHSVSIVDVPVPSLHFSTT
jgi:phage tail tape-measure protein